MQHSTHSTGDVTTPLSAPAVGAPIHSLTAASEREEIPSVSNDDAASDEPQEFFPREPESLQQSGLNHSDVEALVLKMLLNLGNASGRRMADQLKLPFGVLLQVLHTMKLEMLVAYKTAAPMSDYEYELSSAGFERARRYNERCTYFGAAPVPLNEYIASIRAQSIRHARPRFSDLCQAFNDLLLPPAVISQVGQAVNAGHALFLYGAPGNGKTSIAERVIRGVRSDIWIPRTVTVGGEIIRLFDPSSHEELPPSDEHELFQSSRVDRRWVHVRRPTVIVGGELTLQHLEITYNQSTGINESPLQFKSNCGALVIDDFGRQRIGTTELLNRWIIPLEKGFDYLALPSGRQLQIPFDQLLVFATNLEPKQLFDEAFLRRIPYKIEVFDPSESQFRELFQQRCPQFGFEYSEEAVTHLIGKHFNSKNRSLRYCHARDLLTQAKNFCEFHERPFNLTPEIMDIAATNYFAGL